jgi:MFS family permease
MHSANRSAGLPLVLTVSLATQILMAFAVTIPPVLAPRVAADVGVAPESLGVFMMVLGAAAMLASPFVGRFIHRVGAVRVNQAGVVLIALGLRAGAAGAMPMLMVCALLLGVGQTTAMPAAAHLLARVTPPHRLSVVLSIRQAGMPVGAAMAGLLVPSLVLALDWRFALALLGAVLMATVLFEAPLRHRIKGGPHRRPAGGVASLRNLMRSMLANPGLRAITLCSLSYSFAQCSLMVFLVSYLNLELGYSLASAGAVMALSQALALAARLFWGWVPDRCGDSFAVIAGLGAAAAALCTLAGFFTPGWPLWAVCTVAAAMGGTLTAWNGVYAGGVVRLSPEGEAGATMGASNVFGYFGMLAGPPVCALAISLSGTYAAAFFLSAAVIIPAAWRVRTAGRLMARAGLRAASGDSGSR